MCAQPLSRGPTLRNPKDCNPPGSSVHGISQVRILDWDAISFSRGSLWPKDQTCISCVFGIDGWILYRWATGENPFVEVEVVYICVSKARMIAGGVKVVHPQFYSESSQVIKENRQVGYFYLKERISQKVCCLLNTIAVKTSNMGTLPWHRSS